MSVAKREGSPFYWYEFKLDNRRFRGSTGKTSEREARQVEREKKAEARQLIQNGELGHKYLTIDDLFGRFWSSHAHRAKAAKDLRAHIEQILELVGKRRIYCELGNNDVAEFIQKRREMGALRHSNTDRGLVRIGELSDGTLANILTTWQCAHNMARDLWELPVRPIAWRKLKPARSTGHTASLSREKAEELFSYLPPHMQAVALFALGTGCREQQAFQLAYCRVDIRARTAKVQKQKRKGVDWETKHLNETALLGLAMAHNPTAGPDDLVFDITNWRHHWETARARAGIPHFRFHDLRHMFATWLGEGGATLQATSKALGHSSIGVTMRYLEVFDRHTQEAVAKLPTITVGNVEPMQKPKTAGARNE